MALLYLSGLSFMMDKTVTEPNALSILQILETSELGFY